MTVAISPDFWTSDLWRYGWTPALPVVAALIAIAGAITAAVLQANGAVRAQLTQQEQITKREEARQRKIDEGTRVQVQSRLRNICYLSQAFILHPAGAGVPTLALEMSGFAERIQQPDISVAHSVEETTILLRTAANLKMIGGTLERHIGKVDFSETDMVNITWQAYHAAVVASRTAAILGDDETYNHFRTMLGNEELDAIIVRLRNVAAYPFDLYSVMRTANSVEGDVTIIRKSRPTFEPAARPPVPPSPRDESSTS